MTRRSLVLAALLAGLAAGGCHYARGVGYAGRLPPGRPAFTPGDAEGYWIWRDGLGWHLRTTSDVTRHFHGVVETMRAKPGELRPVGAVGGGVREEGPHIVFDYRTEGGEQGFDWTSGSRCARFELYIDDTTRPLRVFLGRVEASPVRVPFAVCG